MKKNKKPYIIAGSVLGVLLILFAAMAIYVSDYYHAEDSAVSVIAESSDIEVSSLEGGNIAFIPDDADTGLIFYPGGKVEYTAYSPLMKALAERGILCVLIKMPYNLAVLDINAANGIESDFPQIKSWYIGGHSLGGSMAAAYVDKHSGEFNGLVLLASYSTTDLSSTSLNVISVYGTSDEVLDLEKYTESKKNLPSDFSELVISGGCHAYFGKYGPQKGDGTPSITNVQQITLTADYIAEKAA